MLLEDACYSGVPWSASPLSAVLFQRLRSIQPGPCRNISTIRGELREVCRVDP